MPSLALDDAIERAQERAYQRLPKGDTFKDLSTVIVTPIRGEKTVNELASEYGVHPVQISQWKRAVQDEAPRFLSSHRGRRAKEEEALKATVYQQIGPLKVEVDWGGEKAGLVG